MRTDKSLLSAGTERMMLDFGKANWIDKARQQPDKVRTGARGGALTGPVADVEPQEVLL